MASYVGVRARKRGHTDDLPKTAHPGGTGRVRSKNRESGNTEARSTLRRRTEAAHARPSTCEATTDVPHGTTADAGACHDASRRRGARPARTPRRSDGKGVDPREILRPGGGSGRPTTGVPARGLRETGVCRAAAAGARPVRSVGCNAGGAVGESPTRLPVAAGTGRTGRGKRLPSGPHPSSRFSRYYTSTGGLRRPRRDRCPEAKE